MQGVFTIEISMLAQKEYEAALAKYGEVFVNAVVEQELQLFADSLDCFDEYATYDAFQEYLEVTT